MAESVERTLVLKFAPDLSAVDSALTGLEQRASRAMSFGTGGSGGSTFSAEGPAIGGGPAPVPGAAPGVSPGAGGFRPARNADDERLWAIRERTALIGADPGQRLQYWQQRSSEMDSGTIGRAKADEQVARAEQALAKAKEREAAAAQRSADAEERRAAAAQKASARGYAAEDRAYQREFKGRQSGMAEALGERAGPANDLEAIAEAAEAAGESGGSAAGSAGRRGGGRRFNPGRGLYRFIGPYFIAQEGLRVANANLEYRDESALARTDEEQLRATSKYNQSLLSVPIAGQGYNFYRNITGKNREQMLADRRMEESKADDEETTREFVQRRESAGTVDSLQRRSAGLGLSSSFGRQKADIQNQYEDWQRQEEDRIDQLRRAAHEAGLTPEERDRRRQAYRTAESLSGREGSARRDLARGQYGSLVRDLNYRVGDLGFAEPGLQARLEGQYGTARERDFEGQLQQREAEASRYSNVYGRAVARQNAERRQIEQNEITEGVTQRDAGSDVGRALLARRPQLSANLRYAEERRTSQREARSPEDLRSRLDDIAVREEEESQRRNDQIYVFSQSIRSRNDVLSFQLSNSFDPRGIASAKASARETLNSTLLSAAQAGQGGQAGAIPDILKGGQLALRLQQQNYVRSFEPVEADPRRSIVTGEGAADSGSILKEISDDLKTLKKAGTSLDEIKNTINARLGVAL